MNIKVISLRKILKEGSRFLGIAQISLNDSLVINDVRIIQGPDSKFIAMPSYKVNDEYYDFAHPTNADSATPIKEIVIKAYTDGIHEVGENEEFNVTKVKIKRLSNETGIVAIATVILNDCFALHQLALVKELSPEGKYKAKILMPIKEDNEGNKKNIYSVTNKEFLEHLTRAVMEAYMQDENEKHIN